MHALVRDKIIQEYKEFQGAEPPVLSSNKGAWLLVVSDGMPEVDSLTHRIDTTVTISDTTVTFEHTVVERKLADACVDIINLRKQDTTRRILLEAPEHKQRNAGIGGIYTPEEDERIRNVIKTHRDIFNTDEAALLAAANMSELIAIYSNILAR